MCKEFKKQLTQKCILQTKTSKTFSELNILPYVELPLSSDVIIKASKPSLGRNQSLFIIFFTIFNQRSFERNCSLTCLKDTTAEKKVIYQSIKKKIKSFSFYGWKVPSMCKVFEKCLMNLISVHLIFISIKARWVIQCWDSPRFKLY